MGFGSAGTRSYAPWHVPACNGYGIYQGWQAVAYPR